MSLVLFSQFYITYSTGLCLHSPTELLRRSTPSLSGRTFITTLQLGLLGKFQDKSKGRIYDMIFIDAYDGDHIFPYKLWDADSPFLKALNNRLHP